jgi:hypothetical protein
MSLALSIAGQIGAVGLPNAVIAACTRYCTEFAACR